MYRCFLAISLTLWCANCSAPDGTLPQIDGDGGEQADGDLQYVWARAATAGNGAVIRATPSEMAEATGLLPNGCVAALTGEANDGYREIDYFGVTGWIQYSELRLLTKNVQDCVVEEDKMLLPWDAGRSYEVLESHGDAGHLGIDQWAWDFSLAVGDPVLAVRSGVVRLVRDDSSVGGCSSEFFNDNNFVVIDHGDGYEAAYLHIDTDSSPLVVGQEVQRGQHIANAGEIGWTCEPLLHLQIQISPANGGGTDPYNQTVQRFFYDTGVASDPLKGETPTSANQRPQ